MATTEISSSVNLLVTAVRSDCASVRSPGVAHDCASNWDAYFNTLIFLNSTDLFPSN